MIDNAHGREKLESSAKQAPLSEQWLEQIKDRTKLSPNSSNDGQSDSKSFLPKVDIVESQKDVGDSKTGDTKKVVWENDLDKAAERAKKENKPLIICLSHSESSKDMDERTKDCKEFQSLGDKAVFARIDLDKLPQDEYQRLKEKYHIAYLPTTMVIDPATGEEKMRHLGFSYFPDAEASAIASVIAGKGDWVHDYAELERSVQAACQKNQVTEDTIEKAKQAIKVAEDHLGPNHIYTITAETSLARAYAATGNLPEAEKYLHSVIAKSESNFNSPTRTDSQKACDATLLFEGNLNLGRIKQKNNDKESARAAYQKALEYAEYLRDAQRLLHITQLIQLLDKEKEDK